MAPDGSWNKLKPAKGYLKVKRPKQKSPAQKAVQKKRELLEEFQSLGFEDQKLAMIWIDLDDEEWVGEVVRWIERGDWDDDQLKLLQKAIRIQLGK